MRKIGADIEISLLLRLLLLLFPYFIRHVSAELYLSFSLVESSGLVFIDYSSFRRTDLTLGTLTGQKRKCFHDT